ncbi:phosphotransferase family protein [Kitasatospora purpeofusca]|uniref:phosphotransferase family protein n=1 Tax=Kitasatospora purpeofusca TaxID=67352 RepID=UPI0022512FC7|nr:aminoglycoside phosphotransferase family protein [Kitasatospora purpeofusca]MCX4753481.1 aminoglycoside phosphotransferase family protein [Kitasatospora purpeofusca]WSR32977.1 aminoglycoside phosphotransferase family protein [Kitasatospora purpeofusca]
MSAPDEVINRPHPLLLDALTEAGFDATGARFTTMRSGTDSLPFAATTRDGEELVVKVRRAGSRSRYPTAAWASARMREAGVPAACVLWYSREACVETRCPGQPIEAEPPRPPDLDAAVRAGEILRRLHTIKVSSFGQLDGQGVGQHSTIQGWFLALPDRRAPSLNGLHLPGLLNRARFVLEAGADRLPATAPKLLHGDWVGRHLFTDGHRITGVVDLESARGGDPLAELAGWSLREPGPMTEALLVGYFDGPLPAESLLPLVLFRLRIAVSLLHVHVAFDDQDMVRLRAAQIQADLDDLDHGHLAAVPRITPNEHSSGRRRP